MSGERTWWASGWYARAVFALWLLSLATSEEFIAIPGTAAAVPGAEITVPHTETSAPDNETRVPDIQAVVPGTQAAVPDIETTILGIDAAVPDDRAVVLDNQATVQSNQAADPGIKAGVPDTDEARAISDDTPLAEAVNALFASTPEKGEDGVPVGDRLGPLLPQHPDTPLESPVVVRRYSVPQGPGKERDVPVMVTQYALPTDEKSQGDHNVLLTQISFPDGVPGVERQREEEEKDAYSTGTSVELINTTEEYDTALETKHTEHTQSKGIQVERKDEGDTTTTTPPELQGTPGNATDLPQGLEHLWDFVEVRELTRPQEVENEADKRKEPWDVPGRVWQGTKPRTPSALEMMVKKATTEDGQRQDQTGSGQLGVFSTRPSAMEAEDERGEETGYVRPGVGVAMKGDAPTPTAYSSYPDRLPLLSRLPPHALPPHRHHQHHIHHNQQIPSTYSQEQQQHLAQQRLAQQLHQYLYHIAQSSPQTQMIVQQMLRHRPEAQRLLERVLMEQWYRQQHMLRQGEKQQDEENEEEEVETFNIVITKNLTGGQSRPSVQVLPDAQVDAMLLNTTVSSVHNLEALRQVVDAAVAHAAASQPVAIQEAVAQVVESPGQEATVKVINSSIPDRGQLESTLNTLLGSEVVFSGASTGRVPRPQGSVVDALLQNTVGSGGRDNLHINSTSKTNVVNIFIINIIGGVDGESQLSSPPPPPPSPPLLPALLGPESANIPRPHFPGYPPTPPQSMSDMPVFTMLPPASFVPPVHPGDAPGAFPHSQESDERPGEASLHHQQGNPQVSPPSPPLPQQQQKPVTSPEQQQQQQESSVLRRPPGAAPSRSPKPSMPQPASLPNPQPGSPPATSASHLNPGGILLNNNQMLNLLPEFVRATTIPPVVPLYNTSVHTILGKQPSVIGLLPNKLFDIVRPQLLPSNNATIGGIIRKNMLGNLTSYFPPSEPPVDAPPTPQVGSATIRRPVNTQYQYPLHSGAALLPPSGSSVPSNPLPFLRRYGSLVLPKTKASPSSRLPAHGSARSPRPQHSAPQRSPQSPLQQFVVVNTETPTLSNDENVLSITDDASTPRSAVLQSQQDDAKDAPQTSVKKNKKSKKPKQKSSLSSIRTMAADAVAAVDGMNNVMKAVAIGAVPSGIAFVTALWPYWAPFMLGRRRRRDVAMTDTISHDWLSILTGNKYKGANTEFPAAWMKKKDVGMNRRPPKDGSSQDARQGSVHMLKIPEEEVFGATTEHSAAKRSTEATLPSTDLNQSIVQVMSSLTDRPSPDASLPQPDTAAADDVSEEASPPDMSLVSNFLYSALHDFNGDTPQDTSAEEASKIPINLDLMGEHIHIIHSPAMEDHDSQPDSTTLATTTRQPVTRRTTRFTTTRPPTRRTTINRRPSLTTTTPRTTTTWPPPKRTTLRRTTTVRTTTPRPTTTTTTRPPRRTTPRTTTRRPMTTTRPRRTQPTLRTLPTTTTTTTTTTTPATTTTTPTTTTTTKAPGIMERITSTIGATNQQMKSAFRFVGSVALYGAAALMPIWVPIVLGKRRRKREAGDEAEEENQRLSHETKVLEMIQKPPSVKERKDGKLKKKIRPKGDAKRRRRGK